MGGVPNKAGFAVVLAAIAISVGVGVGLWSRAPLVTRAPTSSTALEHEVTVEVHVSGWVLNPGVVSVTDGAIVADAVEAAGGFREGADVGSLNLAAPVGPGDQIVVPGPGGDGDAGVGQSVDGHVSLNHATVLELEGLPGVGPVLAERIVSFRDVHGGFDSVEDLLEVPGIGESKLASLRDLVRP